MHACALQHARNGKNRKNPLFLHISTEFTMFGVYNMISEVKKSIGTHFTDLRAMLVRVRFYTLFAFYSSDLNNYGVYGTVFWV